MVALHEFIKERGMKKQYNKQQKIFHSNERANECYFIESGLIKISNDNSNGESVTLAVRKSGDLAGLMELLAKKPTRRRNAQCLTDCTVYSLPAVLLWSYLEENKEAWAELSVLMANRLLDSQHFIYVLATMTVPQRLCWLLQKFSIIKQDQLVTFAPLTHEEIAHIIGCSRQKVTTNLNLWRKAGFIHYTRGYITTVQPEKLYALVAE